MRPKVRANALQARIAVAKRMPKTASRSRPRGRAGCRARAASPASGRAAAPRAAGRSRGAGGSRRGSPRCRGPSPSATRAPRARRPRRQQEERDGCAAWGTKASSRCHVRPHARQAPTFARTRDHGALERGSAARPRRRVRRARARDRTPGAPRTRPRTPPPPTPRESRRRWLPTRPPLPRRSRASGASRSRVDTERPVRNPRASSSSETTSGA